MQGATVFICLIFLIFISVSVDPAQHNQTVSLQYPTENTSLNGVYRIDMAASDKLYSVIENASSSIPFGDQQRFFIDLAVRLTPPDLLAIEQHNTHISLGSSRAPRMNLVADGIAHTTRAQDGHIVRVRFTVENTSGHHRLVFTSTGRKEDNFTVVFEPLDNGRLRVVRRIEADALDQPLVIQTVYTKISDTAHWDLYGETQLASAASGAGSTSSQPVSEPVAAKSDRSNADVLRRSLDQWIDATNNRNIEKQMSFYVPRLKAYYLTRNTSLSFVRDEKAKVFATARLIEIRAEEPEIIFQDSGRTAIMRYRKQYRIQNGKQSRSGQVIQELRWRQEAGAWRIFSERDIRVLR